MDVPVAVAADDYPGWVDLFADPIRSRRAYWHLVASGQPALEAVRAGLHHEQPDVRMFCARVLDHLADEDSFPDLIAMLADPDPRVRGHTLHALACDRCKDNACRPAKEDVLPRAIQLLGGDPDRGVRAGAVEVVGRWVHSDERAAVALVAARDHDPAPAVRKKAGWYAPGGTIFKKTLQGSSAHRT